MSERERDLEATLRGVRELTLCNTMEVRPVKTFADRLIAIRAQVDAALAAPVVVTDELREAVEWVINDAKYKSPEQVGEVAERWIGKLQAALRGTDK